MVCESLVGAVLCGFSCQCDIVVIEHGGTSIAHTRIARYVQLWTHCHVYISSHSPVLILKYLILLIWRQIVKKNSGCQTLPPHQMMKSWRFWLPFHHKWWWDSKICRINWSTVINHLRQGSKMSVRKMKNSNKPENMFGQMGFYCFKNSIKCINPNVYLK